MLAVNINRVNFEYDVNSIVKAFFPGETVAVLTPETGYAKKKQAQQDIFLEIEINEQGAELWVKKELSGEESERAAVSAASREPDRDGISGQGTEKLTWKYEEGKELSFKDGFKRFLYQSLASLTGRTLPWGNLTGIRPTKIAYGLLEEGKDEEEICSFMRERHFVSEEKAALSIDIAKREKELLSGIHYEGGYSLYIGIPFCPTTCLYCSFTSYPIGAYKKQVEDYIDCLIREMELVSASYAGKILDTVYIGGGTPTTLEASQLDRMIAALKERFDFSTVQEFTVEAGRADSITLDKLKVLKKHGVTRISVNPQTMKQETLNIIGRRHTVEQVEEAFALAREAGFDNINMDLILGLPGETEEDVQRTIDRVVQLGPDSLTVHSLAIKRASRLSQWILENGISTLNNTDETMRIAAFGARKLGMEPYYLYRQKNMSGNFENVGYAVPGKFGIYNILIMEEKQTIIALGAGSISKLVLPGGRIERSDSLKDVKLYIEQIDQMLERKEKLFLLEQEA